MLWISIAPFFQAWHTWSCIVMSWTQIFKIQAQKMNYERYIRFELLVRLCPNCTGKNHLLWIVMQGTAVCYLFTMPRVFYDIGFLTWVSLSGAEIRSVCTEAGMFAIRARRKTVTEKDFLDAVNKVIKGYQKFSATPKYMVYNWVSCLLHSASLPKKTLKAVMGLTNWAWYEPYPCGSFIWTWTCLCSDCSIYYLAA